MKRSRLKPVSKKHRKYMATIHDEREAFRQQFPCCMVCGCAAEHVHEICRRSQSSRPQQRCNWLSVCGACHEKMGAAAWPMTVQLVRKALRDREGFDLPAWLSLRGRAATEVTFEDLFWAAIEMLDRLSGPRRDRISEMVDEGE